MLHDEALMMAKVGEVNWGQTYEGTPPKSEASYRTVDTPFVEYLEDLHRLAIGLSPVDRKKAQQSANRRGILKALGLKGDDRG